MDRKLERMVATFYSYMYTAKNPLSIRVLLHLLREFNCTNMEGLYHDILNNRCQRLHKDAGRRVTSVW